MCLCVQRHLGYQQTLAILRDKLHVLQSIDPCLKPSELTAEQKQHAPSSFLQATLQMSITVFNAQWEKSKMYHYVQGGNTPASSDRRARRTNAAHIPFVRDRWNGLESAVLLENKRLALEKVSHSSRVTSYECQL